MAKLLIVYKEDSTPARDAPSEVFEDVLEVTLRHDGWLVIVKNGDGGEFGVNRDEISSYWVAADDVFDAEAARHAGDEQGKEQGGR